uniref:Uncharacterized protein n=1 Tax=Arundo donax TaxID=35708 RepID=A0A0A9C1P6_ARUDO
MLHFSSEGERYGESNIHFIKRGSCLSHLFHVSEMRPIGP